MNAPLRMLALAAMLASCRGAPPTPPVAPVADAARAPSSTPSKPAAAAPTRQPQLLRLGNGVTVSIREATGRDAQLQFGLLSGTSFVAPGVAELATSTLMDDSDPSSGRPSLRHAISQLGGTLQMQLGPMTTWLDMRVPGPKWQEALAALQTALSARTQSRHQLARMRDDLVVARCEWIRREPRLVMARSLLLGDRTTADYVHGLLDRDPGEISLFQSRMFRPERAILALEVPGDPERVAATLSQDTTNGFGSWKPAPPVPGATPVMDRSVASGLFWTPTYKPGCKVAIVLMMPDFAFAGARTTDLLVLQCCLTMDGTGGRLEQMMQERGLGDIRWQSELVQTSDSLALVLTADMNAQQARDVWQTVQRARQSLRDVPPTASELALARRRVRLTASLGQLDARSRLRAATNMQLRGQPADLLEQRLATIEKSGEPGPGAVDDYLKLAAAVVVVGDVLPTDLADMKAFDLLPAGFEPATALAPPAVADAASAPWLDRAAEAVGGANLLRQLQGFTAETRLVHDRAPAVTDSLDWQHDGTLSRTREVLGKTVVTQLRGTSWTEQLDKVTKPLTAKEAEQLRRECSRHPLELLAAHVRGELDFRAIAQRTVGDRELMVLEATGDHFDRLRIHIDTLSHLIRVVESWETLADGSLLHLEETWSDYRNAKGLRAPFHRFTVQNDGENRLETVFTRFEPKLRAP